MSRNTQLPIALQFTGSRPRRPPRIDLLFDAEVRNPARESQWFLLPQALPVEERADLLGVMGAEVARATGAVQVSLVRFIGVDGMQGVLLEGGRALVLKGLTIGFHGDRPRGTVRVDATVARQVLIDEQPVEAWLGTRLISTPNGPIRVDQLDVISSRFAPGGKNLDMRLLGQQRIPIDVQLPD